MKKSLIFLFSFIILLSPRAFVHAFPASLSSGLVSYWHFDELSGNAVDSSGNGNTLINQSASYAPGKINNAALIGHDSIYRYFYKPSMAPISGSYTISAWINFNSHISADSMVIEYDDLSALGNQSFYFFYSRVDSNFHFGFTDSTGTVRDHEYSFIPSDGIWYNFVIVFDDSADTITLYKDNVPVVSEAETNTPSVVPADLVVGYDNTHNNTPFDGLIDEVGIWNRALSASEVNDLYTSYSAPPNTPPTAIGVATSTDEDISTPITLLGTDAEGDPLTFATTTNPAHGTLSTLVGSTTVYTPNPNYNGSDSFQYVVSDGQATSSPATATITINAVNDPPVLASISNQRAPVGDTISFTAASADVDGAVPVYSIANSSASTTASIDSTTGFFTWNTSGAATGDYVFTIAVSDGTASVSTTTTVALFVDAGSVGGVYTNGQLVSPEAAAPRAVSATSSPGAPKPVMITSTTTVPMVIKQNSIAPLHPPTPVTLPPKATTAAPTSPKVISTQTIHAQTAPATPVVAPLTNAFSGNTNQTNQLSAAASSGFKVPLWACGVGGSVLAGVGAWWWLGGLAL